MDKPQKRNYCPKLDEGSVPLLVVRCETRRSSVKRTSKELISERFDAGSYLDIAGRREMLSQCLPLYSCISTPPSLSSHHHHYHHHHRYPHRYQSLFSVYGNFRPSFWLFSTNDRVGISEGPSQNEVFFCSHMERVFVLVRGEQANISFTGTRGWQSQGFKAWYIAEQTAITGIF